MITQKNYQSLIHRPFDIDNMAVYTRGNKPRLTLAAAYIIRERNYLYEHKLPAQDKPRLEKAINVDFVPFIRSVRVLCKPQLIFSCINNPNANEKSRSCKFISSMNLNKINPESSKGIVGVLTSASLREHCLPELATRTYHTYSLRCKQETKEGKRQHFFE